MFRGIMDIYGLLCATSILYGLSAFHYLLFLIVKKDKIAVVGLYSARIGFLANLLALTILIIRNGTEIFFTPRASFLLFSLSMVSVFLYFASKHKLSVSGAFLMPWAFGSSFLSLLTRGVPQLNFSVGFIGSTHIITASLGYACFAFSALVSLIYLVFSRQLKRGRFSVFYLKVPSLALLESVSYKSMVIGFAFITVAILAGSLWSKELFNAYWLWHPKQISTLLSWFIYAVIVHLYLHKGYRGKRFCYLSIGAFILILIGFLGVNLFSKGDVHSL